MSLLEKKGCYKRHVCPPLHPSIVTFYIHFQVLERARKAEAEAASLKQHLKQETSTSKKTIREMETQLAESTALSKKSEREYITLRDSIKSMSDTWKLDVESLKSEMRKKEDKWRREVDGVGKKYKDLCLTVKEKEQIMEDCQRRGQKKA